MRADERGSCFESLPRSAGTGYYRLLSRWNRLASNFWMLATPCVSLDDSPKIVGGNYQCAYDRQTPHAHPCTKDFMKPTDSERFGITGILPSLTSPISPVGVAAGPRLLPKISSACAKAMHPRGSTSATRQPRQETICARGLS